MDPKIIEFVNANLPKLVYLATPLSVLSTPDK